MTQLPPRPGVRPKTSASGLHRQLSQQSPPGVWGHTVAAIFSLDHVIEGRSAVSAVSTRAAFLEDIVSPILDGTSLAPPGDRLEPVHIHGVFDTSLHLCLPAKRAREVCGLGWGEPHRYADHETEIMVYGPRDRDELITVMQIVRESLSFARS